MYIKNNKTHSWTPVLTYIHMTAFTVSFPISSLKESFLSHKNNVEKRKKKTQMINKSTQIPLPPPFVGVAAFFSPSKVITLYTAHGSYVHRTSARLLVYSTGIVSFFVVVSYFVYRWFEAKVPYVGENCLFAEYCEEH